MVLEEAIGGPFDPGGGSHVRRTAAWRVVLEPSVLRRIVRRRQDHAIGQVLGADAVVGQDRVRDHGRGRVSVAGVDHRENVVCGKDLQDAGEGRSRERVSVDAQEQRPIDAILPPVEADRLSDRQHVGLVERVAKRRPAVAGGAEMDPLGRL